MQAQEVKTREQKRLFHRLPVDLYRNDPAHILPLKQDIEAVFDPKKNRLFDSGEAIRFILTGNKGACIGRVAAFYNSKQKTEVPIRAGGMGFFECIDDPAAAAILFDACRNWLEGKGLNAMDGPVNFGSRDRWWGLLVKGFAPPVYGMNYHLPYYRKLFEGYGFQNYFEQYTYTLHRNDRMPKIIYEIKERLEHRGAVKFITADAGPIEKFAADFVTIYNKAWAHHADVEPITHAQSRKLMQEIKPVMDPRLLIFSYVQNEPAGFFIGLPDANQILTYAKGNLNLIGMLQILLRKPFVQMKNIYGIIFGVVPEFQLKGIEAGMAAKMHEMVNSSRHYEQMELLWIGDFNKKMLNFTAQIQAKPFRTLITYRKIFDETIPFHRCPIIE